MYVFKLFEENLEEGVMVRYKRMSEDIRRVRALIRANKALTTQYGIMRRQAIQKDITINQQKKLIEKLTK